METELNLILNHYRSAELAGARVIMKLAGRVESMSLAMKLTRHLADEANHALEWTRRIDELGGVIAQQSDPYQKLLGNAYGSIPRRTEELLALSLVSERRGLATYEAHLQSLDRERYPTIRESLEKLISDESWHVSWISASLEDLASVDGSIRGIVAKAEEADFMAMAALVSGHRASADVPGDGARLEKWAPEGTI